MSQFYRLIDFYDAIKVDIITSGYNYIFQALGILVFMVGLYYKPTVFSKRKLFIELLISGSIFMVISQLSMNALLIELSGYVFNLHIGIYFGFYLTMLASGCPKQNIGTVFGIAYAIGSLGTYFISMFNDEMFLTSKTITAVYFILISITIALILYAEDINYKQQLKKENLKDIQFVYLIIIVCIMTTINVFGSDLYYSLPVAKDVNWNLIRAFYSIGLILAGILIDRNRFIGEVTVVGSLAYPLITTALIGEGVTNTTILSLSYFFRGFLTIYYITAFVSLNEKGNKYLILAPCGLLTSRISEALLSILLMTTDIPNIYKLIFSSFCFIPLLILSSLIQRKQYSIPMSQEKRLATFAEKYSLTSRETEIISCLNQNMSDSEISAKLFISKNTVRFHISNILKKTESSSRTEIIRKYQSI